jgi:hypothetical protein
MKIYIIENSNPQPNGTMFWYDKKNIHFKEKLRALFKIIRNQQRRKRCQNATLRRKYYTLIRLFIDRQKPMKVHLLVTETKTYNS